jgi:hypothetical protein
MNTILLLDCLVLFVVPIYFVVHGVYKDGVFGRAGLLGMSFCSAGILMEAGLGMGFYVPSIVVLLITSFTVFICWHLARFHLRVVRNEPRRESPAA